MFQFMFMVQLLVKFRFFIQELWERKSLQILYECWRRVYHALLAQLFIAKCSRSDGPDQQNGTSVCRFWHLFRSECPMPSRPSFMNYLMWNMLDRTGNLKSKIYAESSETHVYLVHVSFMKMLISCLFTYRHV